MTIKCTGEGQVRGGRMSRAMGWLAAASIAIALCPSAQAADPARGGEYFKQHCVFCHGADGKGAMPGMPDFSRGERLMQSDGALLSAIKSGKGVMPGFEGLLKDEEILDIIAYLRTLR